MCWCAIVREPHVQVHSDRYSLQHLPEKWEFCICAGFFNSTMRCSKSSHSFGHAPRLAYPPDDYYYHNFPQLSVVCDPMLYIHSIASLNLSGEFDNTLCQVIYSQFGLAIHQNDHQARRRFIEWAQNEIAVVPDFHKRILFSDEAHFWLNGYVNKQNCRIWSEANPQVYVETPLHPEKLTVWCALWAGGILLQKR
ncbi:hypothetical protein TNCV_3643831 [Trichonephila clavipes]|nr:hypothetical protein TNCV_3643831 [Trichonephila clavipes]